MNIQGKAKAPEEYAGADDDGRYTERLPYLVRTAAYERTVRSMLQGIPPPYWSGKSDREVAAFWQRQTRIAFQLCQQAQMKAGFHCAADIGGTATGYVPKEEEATFGQQLKYFGQINQPINEDWPSDVGSCVAATQNMFEGYCRKGLPNGLGRTIYVEYINETQEFVFTVDQGLYNDGRLIYEL